MTYIFVYPGAIRKTQVDPDVLGSHQELSLLLEEKLPSSVCCMNIHVVPRLGETGDRGAGARGIQITYPPRLEITQGDFFDRISLVCLKTRH